MAVDLRSLLMLSRAFKSQQLDVKQVVCLLVLQHGPGLNSSPPQQSQWGYRRGRTASGVLLKQLASLHL